jgi:hypothetical protein
MAIKIATGGAVISGAEKLVDLFYDGKLFKDKSKEKGGRSHDRKNRYTREGRDDSDFEQEFDF